MLHEREHPYFSTMIPKPAKYDLKDTFFREKWATKEPKRVTKKADSDMEKTISKNKQNLDEKQK